MILEARSLTKRFSMDGRDVAVLEDVTFSLDAGGRCAVVGPSGSGKTTLLGLCAGLDAPSAGTVRIDGVDLWSLDEDGRAALRAASVGFVFQNFRLLPALTALENVMVPIELKGDSDAAGRAAAWLSRVGLSDRLSHRPAQLSGGEQQRVALARAFAARPKLLFADEPTGNLDSENNDRVTDLLFELNESERVALVIVTHNAALAARTGRVLTLDRGRLVRSPA